MGSARTAAKPWHTAVVAIALAAAPGAAFGWDVEALRSSGPPDRRVDIAVLGDGYTAEDQQLLSSHAAEIALWLFAPPLHFGPDPYVELFKDYAGVFNVKLVHVVSNERGADGGALGGLRDTYFSSDLSCGSGLCVDEALVHEVANAAVPEHDVILLLVNEQYFAARSGGGVIAMTVSDPFGPQTTLQHELGHVLGHLADEIFDRAACELTGPCPRDRDCSEPNATKYSDRDRVKWRDWIASETPVPTPDTLEYVGDVGAFEGNRYCASGIFRPTNSWCAMAYGDLEFCPVCREAMVLAFWSRASLVDTRSPAEETVVVGTCQPASFAVTTPDVPLSTTWALDGDELASGTTLSVPAGTLAAGRHTVRVTVRDATPYVRTDRQGVTAREERWTVAACPCDGQGAPTACAPARARAEGCGAGGAGIPSLAGALAAGAARLVRRLRRRSA